MVKHIDLEQGVERENICFDFGFKKYTDYCGEDLLKANKA